MRENILTLPDLGLIVINTCKKFYFYKLPELTPAFIFPADDDPNFSAHHLTRAGKNHLAFINQNYDIEFYNLVNNQLEPNHELKTQIPSKVSCLCAFKNGRIAFSLSDTNELGVAENNNIIKKIKLNGYCKQLIALKNGYLVGLIVCSYYGDIVRWHYTDIVCWNESLEKVASWQDNLATGTNLVALTNNSLVFEKLFCVEVLKLKIFEKIKNATFSFQGKQLPNTLSGLLSCLVGNGLIMISNTTDTSELYFWDTESQSLEYALICKYKEPIEQIGWLSCQELVVRTKTSVFKLDLSVNDVLKEYYKNYSTPPTLKDLCINYITNNVSFFRQRNLPIELENLVSAAIAKCESG